MELGQDYLSSALNGNAFILADALSYKLFWLMFIPLAIAFDYGVTRVEQLISGLLRVGSLTFLVIGFTVLHLVLFSFVLFGISNLIHEQPMELLYLLYEKLSTRLYIALSIYLFLSAAHVLLTRKKSKPEPDENHNSTTLTVKNGRRSVIVDISDIKWIGSDGAYLDIYTTGQKHVVLDSLKNLIKTLPANFKRIHRSTIVNTDCITELKSRGNGDYDVLMDDNRVLRLSRNYAKNLKGSLL